MPKPPHSASWHGFTCFLLETRQRQSAAMGRFAKTALALAAVGLCAALAATPAAAKQTRLFVEDFGSAAQPNFASANGLALEADGDLLVIDSNAKTVSRWNPDGTPDNFAALGTNVIDGEGGADLTPENGLTFHIFAGGQQVAVDNSETATKANIYVTQGPQEAGNLIDIFAVNGEYLGQLTGAGATKFGTSGFSFSPCGVAVDDAGNVYAAGGFEKKIYKFDPAANPPVNGDHVATIVPPEEACQLAAGAGPGAGALFVNTYTTFKGNSVLKFDGASGAFQYVVEPGEARLISVEAASGHVFSVRLDSSVANTVREFDALGPSPSLVSEFQAGSAAVRGIAVDGASGRLYLSRGSPQPLKVDVLGPVVTVPEETTGKAEITGDTSVRLKGAVNPDGEPLTECFFEYDTAQYFDNHRAGKEGEATHGQTAPCEPAPGGIGVGTDPVVVQANIGGLSPETLYHYRLIAKNANAALYPKDINSAARGANQSFRTPGKPNIKGQWAVGVTRSEATLKATINPENSPTAYHIEWGTQKDFEEGKYPNVVPVPDEPIGSGEVDKTVSQVLARLEPGATYHWRTVASNGIGESEGPDRSFTTYVPIAPNPDCPNQDRSSASLPDCRAYEMVTPIDKAGTDMFCPVNGVELNRVGCWTQSTPLGDKLTYSTPRAFGDSVSAKIINQYIATRTPSGWSSHGINAPQGTTIFDPGFGFEELPNPFRGFSEDLSSAWTADYNATPLAPGGRAGCENVYRRDNSSDSYEALSTADPRSGETCYVTNIRGFSGDGRRVFADVERPLTKDAAPNTKYQVYEISGGKAKLLSVLPSGEADPDFSRVGAGGGGGGISRNIILDNAVSGDGSRVFWTSTTSDAVDGPGRIYVRIDGKATVPVSEAVAPGHEFRFWAASEDGAKALFSRVLVGGSGEELYEFHVATETATMVAGGLVGVAGAADDLSHVYFVSTEALDAGAEAGEHNLYLYREGEVILIATLAAKDEQSAYSNTRRAPIYHVARTTPDGRHLVFQSSRSLTGYDNADALTGEPIAEVYLYDADSEEFVCASCNPSGARPAGAVPPSPWTGFPADDPVAAWIPTWEWSLNPLRPLSDDGDRLFFNSFDALLPQDTNGVQDVYQWEAPDSGDCDEADGNYFDANGGCLSLISTGQSSQDSEFVEASADGDSVFFKTASSLDPGDPGLIDIYVARVGGGYPRVAPPNPCLGDACQSVPPAPEDPTPASSAFEGAGNVVEPPPRRPRCPQGKRRVRRAGKVRCVRKHRSNPKRRGAANGNRRAAR